MNRVIVVGTTGSGKTTLAGALAQKMNCPFIELDALFWNPGWVKTPPDEFRQRVTEAIAPERWAAGGNYGTARDLVWQPPHRSTYHFARRALARQPRKLSRFFHEPRLALPVGAAIESEAAPHLAA